MVRIWQDNRTKIKIQSSVKTDLHHTLGCLGFCDELFL